MGTPLDTRAEKVEQRPGDFPRHSSSGAPYVTDPTKTRKPTGKKDELIAKCAERGIEVPTKVTVAQLQELLGPEMAMSMYGRPSSLGKQIENATNLQKWSERATALGMFIERDLLNELAHLSPEQLNLDDADARAVLDGIVVKAKAAAKAGLAAERGTHAHELTEDFDTEADWIERANRGEDLGLPPDVQAALVRAWEVMLNVSGIEILAVEMNVVDDHWRLAGTLDRIGRLTRDLRFVTPDGQVIYLKAGTVIVLDVKTGKLRCDRGIVQYWHSYAPQVASYAHSVPYDVTTGTRGEWEWEIDQQWAIIAHLDVLAALDGNATCRLVLVDLEAGRQAGDACVWARQWEKRTDVFSLVTDDDENWISIPVEVSSASSPLADDEQRTGSEPVTPDPVLQLANSTLSWSRELKALLAAEWPSGVPTPARVRKGEATWTPEEFERAQAAINEIVGPFDEVAVEPERYQPAIDATSAPQPPQFDDGGTMSGGEVSELLTIIKASPVRSIVNGWLHEAAEAGYSWQPRTTRSVRHFEIARAAFHLASIIHDAPDDAGDATFIELVRTIVASVAKSDQALMPTNPIGVVLAHLSIAEAGNVADLAQSVRENRTLITFSDQGHVVLADNGAAA